MGGIDNRKVVASILQQLFYLFFLNENEITIFLFEIYLVYKVVYLVDSAMMRFNLCI